jgi:hypothetical protein
VGNFWQTSGVSGREIAKLCLKLPRRHCEERSDEAIQPFDFAAPMDCFAEPVIGRRFAPTRWLAMTI